MNLTPISNLNISDDNSLGDLLRRERLDLYQRELLLDTVIQSTPLSMVLTDAAERVVYSNVAARQLLHGGRKLEGLDFVAVLAAIRSEFMHARIIVLTTFEGDVEIHRAIEAGAHGYLLKCMPPAKLADTIHKVHLGAKCFPSEIADRLAEHLSDEPLSAREVEVLQKIAGGNRNSDIAELLFISEETVKGHVKRIIDKLHANDRTQAITIGVRRGIIHL